MRRIVLIAHNLRSCHNVGSVLRTAEGLGITKVYLTGYTPYPMHTGDTRLPHVAAKIDRQIHKTALDAEKQVKWEHQSDIFTVFTALRSEGYTIAAIEQGSDSRKLPDYHTDAPPGPAGRPRGGRG